jgi:L-2,4-diaminobutyrate decarboxylase
MSTKQSEKIAALFSGALSESVERALVGLLHDIFHPAAAYSGSTKCVDLSIRSAAPVPLSELLKDVGVSVVANSVQYRHKWAMAHMVPPTATAGIIGDLLIGALNQCAFIWEEAPVAKALEDAVLRWMAAKLMLTPEFHGLLTSGGTMSNYLAAVFAKKRADALHAEATGRFYAVSTDQAHFSIQKTLRLLGLPDDRLVRVPAGHGGRTKHGSILAAADTIAEAGGIPFFFVCTEGTSNCGRLEPAREFLDASQKYNAWCHIDAAYGGSICLTHRFDDIVAGWSGADSVSWDPHKSMFVPYSVGALFVKSAESLDILRQTSEYALKPEETGLARDPGAAHFYTSRRLDALKLWMTIRHFGDEGFEAATCHCLGLAAAFAKIIDADLGMALDAYPETNIVCFRAVDDRFTETELDCLNAAVQSRLFENGGPLFSCTTMGGRTYLRAVFMNPLLQFADLDEARSKLSLIIDLTANDLFGNRYYEDPSRHQPAP